MPTTAELLAALRGTRATLAPGLSERELSAIETKYRFSFAPDHRLMLSVALPLGERSWPDWRKDDEEDLWGRLAWPADGILFDVDKNSYWNNSWGIRPDQVRDALDVASVRLGELPPLVPIYGHRYLPTDPYLPGNPVLSCYQTDVIYYGTDLLDWFAYEFHKQSTSPGPWRHIAFWSALIEDDD